MAIHGPAPAGRRPAGPAADERAAGERGAGEPAADGRAADPTRGYRFSIVPHTHWDREWYLPFEQFRMRLVRTIDEIVEVLEADPAFRRFTLDGQAIVLEDYLEIRPQRAARLRRLIEGGRMAVGPSYVLPDEYLVGGESLIRNFLRGRQVCERFGGRPMPVGYMPDTFGHVAQLPQILRGFGLDTFVFWRGLGDEADEVGPTFRWRGPDGSEVLAIRQLGSYGSADELGRWGRNGASFHADPAAWPAVAALRLDRFMELFGDVVARSTTPDLLLCNGSDHKPIQRDLPALVEAMRAAHPDATVEIATYDEHVSAVRRSMAAADGLPPAIIEGELCGGKDAHVLRGVNSARIGLKQANESTERALFIAEVLASLAELRTLAGRVTADAGLGVASPPIPYRYPLDELRYAWRELLRNQPHDSISGCSVDETHRDMAQRYASAGQVAARVRREALAAVAGTSAGWTYAEAPAAARSIVNVLPGARTGLVELALPPALRGAGRVRASVDGGGELPVQLSGSGTDRRAAVAARVAGFGAVTIRLDREGTGRPEQASPAGARLVDQRTIENEHYRVHVLADGSLEVTDLRNGGSWSGLHRFEDVADRGDEYTFCPLPGDVAWTSDGLTVDVRAAAAGPAYAELRVDLVARLPRALRRDRDARGRATVPCRITSRIRLVAGVDRIEFRTEVRNAARDHRLRVLFQAPEAERRVRAEGHFGLVRRPALPIWSGEGWLEPPALTHHTSGAVAAGRLTVLGRGLPEYQAVLRADGGVDLALTLLRCVGWLSRDDLATRPGHAGPPIETPEAQCLGKHTFDYAIDLRGGQPDAAILRASQDFRIELVAGPAGADTAGLLAIGGDEVVLGALKGAEDGDGTILRLFAGADAAGQAVLGGAFGEARRCRLDEDPLEEPLAGRSDGGPAGGATAADVRQPQPRVEVRPSEIVTLRLLRLRRSAPADRAG